MCTFFFAIWLFLHLFCKSIFSCLMECLVCFSFCFWWIDFALEKLRFLLLFYYFPFTLDHNIDLVVNETLKKDTYLGSCSCSCWFTSFCLSFGRSIQQNCVLFWMMPHNSHCKMILLTFFRCCLWMVGLSVTNRATIVMSIPILIQRRKKSTNKSIKNDFFFSYSWITATATNQENMFRMKHRIIFFSIRFNNTDTTQFIATKCCA